jgi:hypothetical protein
MTVPAASYEFPRDFDIFFRAVPPVDDLFVNVDQAF